MNNDRASFIGGTDISPILGLSRYASALDVWCMKTGAIPPEDISKKIPVRVGVRLEDTVCELFEETTGKKLAKAEGRFFHPVHPFLGATLDRIVTEENAIFEAKTASAFKAREWETEEIPTEYLIQVLWYLGITGKSHGYVGVLIGNTDFVWKRVDRDEKTIRRLIDRAVEFWEKFVLTKTPPAPKAMDKDTLAALYPDSNHKTIALGDDAARIIESLEGMERDAKALGAQIEESKNILRAMMKDAERGETENHFVHWTTTTTRRLDGDALKKELPDLYERFRKATSSRRFLIRPKSKDQGE